VNKFDTAIASKAHPRAIVRGDFAAWRNHALTADYPTDLYSLKYVFRLEGDPARLFEVASSVDGNDYLFELSSATTADIQAGLWFWDLYVIRTADSERVTVDQGTTRVLENRATDSGDPREFPRKMLALIEKALLNRATNSQLDTLSYSLGVESSATRDPEKLVTFRDKMKKDLIRANRKWRARQGLPHSGTIKVEI